MLRSRRSSSGRRGSEIVEFALVSFELFLVLFAVIEFGRMALVYSNLASASRIGVRYAITHGIDRLGGKGGYPVGNAPATVDDICGLTGVVVDYAKAGLINKQTLSAGCTVTGPGLAGPVGSAVQVTLNYRYDPYVLLPLKVNLSSTAEGVVTY
ncbi:MAG TPA: TadE family protein [Bryobacterales bacterium]|nr:TadE family protein [Bryobacterales bacterium]